MFTVIGRIFNAKKRIILINFYMEVRVRKSCKKTDKEL